MCGIIGYKGRKNGAEIALKALQTLEYRGYDSWGIAVKNTDIAAVKHIGKIGDVTLDSLGISGNQAIGHTRWATHGGVTEKNAHPHCSRSKRIAVVHNGIIENYQELRKALQEKGVTFLSETDTEVIPNLIEDHLGQGKSFQEAFLSTLKELHGNYAIVAMDKESDILLAARNGSPLVLGVGEEEFFVASDVPAFLDHTKEVIYLKDKELAIINDSLELRNVENNSLVERGAQTIEWSMEEAKLGEYPHFMLKEILEQQETILRVSQQKREDVETMANIIKEAKGVFFVACGTAHYASLVGSYIFSKIAKEHVNVILGSEFENHEHFLTDKTLLIAVSQSGETADTLDAVRVAKSKGTKIASIVNVVGSSLTRESDSVLYTNCGPEIGVASTKVCTAQIATLTLLAYTMDGRYEEGIALLQDTAKKCKELLESEDFHKKTQVLAKSLKEKNDLYVIGRGTNFPIALESALKIKEVSYIHAEGMAGGELKHGTISLIEERTPCIVQISPDNLASETISNAMEIRSRGGHIIGISAENNEIFHEHIQIPKCNSPIINIIPAQLLAYHLALERGHDPDKPRNLAKSVTVK